MFGAIKAQFINAEDQQYNIDGRDITSHYITIIDEHARSINSRYTQLKVREEAWKEMGLDKLNKVKELIGKNCEFHGLWEKSNQRTKLSDGTSVQVPCWVFHVIQIKESYIAKSQ